MKQKRRKKTKTEAYCKSRYSGIGVGGRNGKKRIHINRGARNA